MESYIQAHRRHCTWNSYPLCLELIGHGSPVNHPCETYRKQTEKWQITDSIMVSQSVYLHLSADETHCEYVHTFLKGSNCSVLTHQGEHSRWWYLCYLAWSSIALCSTLSRLRSGHKRFNTPCTGYIDSQQNPQNVSVIRVVYQSCLSFVRVVYEGG